MPYYWSSSSTHAATLQHNARRPSASRPPAGLKCSSAVAKRAGLESAFAAPADEANFVDQATYDERPVQAKGNYSEFDMNTPPRFKESNAPEEVQAQHSRYPEEAMAGPAAEASPAAGGAVMGESETGPEPLGPSEAKEADVLMDDLGERTARCLFSKNWIFREEGFLDVHKRLRTGDLNGSHRETFRNLIFKAVLHGYKDRVANVFLAADQVLRELVEGSGQAVGARELQYAANDVIQTLLTRATENNQRIRESALETVLFLADVPDVGGSTFSQVLLKPLKNAKAHKVLADRLQLMEQIIPKFGVVKLGDPGFSVEATMGFLSANFSSPNGDVRSSAVQVARALQELAGTTAVEKHLPKDIKPAIRDQIVGGGDGSRPASKQAGGMKPKPKPAASKPKPAAQPRRRRPWLPLYRRSRWTPLPCTRPRSRSASRSSATCIPRSPWPWWTSQCSAMSRGSLMRPCPTTSGRSRFSRRSRGPLVLTSPKL